MTSYNFTPYNDDFDSDKNFYQILFKHGVAVQARELTQLQSILQDQIKKFGNHIFEQGSVVIPGNSYADLGVEYVKIQDLYSTVDVSVAAFDKKTLVSVTSGVEAVVRLAVDKVGSNAKMFYIVYTKGGTTGSVAKFTDNEEIYCKEDTALRAYTETSLSTGIGSLAFINDGVYYVNGFFVHCPAQATILSKYNSIPTAKVVLQIVESIIDSDLDESLLDPAYGSYNYAAPGADRLKIALVLTTVAVDTVNSADYVELMRYDAGVLIEHVRNPKYSELEKSLARRTFDESGDYIVNGLRTTVIEHLKSPTSPKGKYLSTQGGDSSKVVAVVGTGKAYINGFEQEKISNTYIELDKARTNNHIKTSKDSVFNTNYGQFLYVTNILGFPDLSTFPSVNFYNVSATTGGTLAATGRIIGFDYYSGDPDLSTAIFKLYVTEVALQGGFALSDLASVRYSGNTMQILHLINVPGASKDFTVGEVVNIPGASPLRTGTVYKWDVGSSSLFTLKHVDTKKTPIAGDIITGATSGAFGTVTNKTVVVINELNAAIFKIPGNRVKSIKSATNTYDIQYYGWHSFTMTISGGNATYALPGSNGGTILTPEVGNFYAFSPAGPVALSKFTVSLDGGTLYATATGLSNGVVVKGLMTLTKENLAPRTKTKHAGTTVSGLTPSASVDLTYPDIITLTSVISTVDGNVTNRYKLDNGQRDYFYDTGKLVLRQNYSVPAGTLTATFDYFEHSTTGDYFCIDSYTTLGADYEENIPVYRSDTTLDNYVLRDSIDFRSTFGGSGKIVDIVTPGYKMTSSAKYYVPYWVLIYINRAGQILTKSGTPALNPLKPTPPTESIVLSQLYIPEYTSNIDSISLKNSDSFGYKMSDIRRLDKKISTLEFYSLVSSVENGLINYSVLDAKTGLDRYKTGYIIDDFNSKNVSIASPYDYDFKVNKALGGGIRAPYTYADFELEIDTGLSYNYRVNNGTITANYTDEIAIEQGNTSRVVPLNPFNSFSWVGKLTLTPDCDSWVDTVYLPDISANEEEIVWITAPSYGGGGWGGNPIVYDPTPGTPYTPSPPEPYWIEWDAYDSNKPGTADNGWSVTTIASVGVWSDQTILTGGVANLYDDAGVTSVASASTSLDNIRAVNDFMANADPTFYNSVIAPMVAGINDSNMGSQLASILATWEVNNDAVRGTADTDAQRAAFNQLL